MATDFKQFPFTEMTEYRNKLRACAADMEATIIVLNRVADQLTEETLVGRAGSAALEALKGKLLPSLKGFYEQIMKEDQVIGEIIRIWADQVEPRIVRDVTNKS